MVWYGRSARASPPCYQSLGGRLGAGMGADYQGASYSSSSSWPYPGLILTFFLALSQSPPLPPRWAGLEHGAGQGPGSLHGQAAPRQGLLLLLLPQVRGPLLLILLHLLLLQLLLHVKILCLIILLHLLLLLPLQVRTLLLPFLPFFHSLSPPHPSDPT